MKKLLDSIKEGDIKLLEDHPQSKSGPEAIFRSDSVTRFLGAYEGYLYGEAKQEQRVDDDGFHPSSLGSIAAKCPRYHYYVLDGNEKGGFDGKGYRITRRGSKIHSELQRDFDEMGFLVKAEVAVDWPGPPHIVGHADGIIKFDGRRILLEIKSCKKEQFEMRLKYKRPLDKHFEQANIYAWVLGLDWIWVLYLNKNDEDIEIFDCPADKEAAEKQIAEWGRIGEAHQKKEIPPRKFKEKSRECTYCPMKDICWAKDDNI